MNRRAGRPRARKAKGFGSSPKLGLPRRHGVDDLLASARRKHEAGLLDEAEPLYRRALEIQPEHPDVLHLLGILLHQRGERNDAIDLLERAVAAVPDEAPFLANLAEAYRANGRLDKAIPTFVEALALSPDDADVCLNFANALAEAGDRASAVENYRRALELVPDDGGIEVRLGDALLELGCWEDALECFRRAIALDPGHLDAGVKLADALMTLGRTGDAVATYGEISAKAPFEVGLQLDIGRTLMEHGNPQLAVSYLDRAIDIEPDSAMANSLRARALQEQGLFENAIAGYERALAIDPTLAEAHYGLAGSRKFRAGDPEIRRLEALLDGRQLDDLVRASLGFALAKMYDDAARHDDAFERCAAANALKAADSPFSGSAFVEAVSEAIDVFSGDFFAAREDFGMAGDLPVYILGMPRSGTSLVEQILASHGGIFGGGERREIRQMIEGLPLNFPGRERFPKSVAAMDPPLSRSLGERLLKLLHSLAPEAARVTDKMPNNFLRLAFIALILPQARVIHCRRDPLDTCLSCFFQFFDRGQEFTYDLADLGLYYRQYERLMRHWREVLPLAMIDVSYEDLVAEPERESRRLVEFCALDWDPDCLAYHQTARTVRSASVWQVRQPIYNSSVEKWRAYEKHLGPLKAALGQT